MSRSRRVRKFNDIGCKWIPRACVGVCDSSRHGRRRAPAQLYSPYIILGPNSVDGRGSRLPALFRVDIQWSGGRMHGWPVAGKSPYFSLPVQWSDVHCRRGPRVVAAENGRWKPDTFALKA